MPGAPCISTCTSCSEDRAPSLVISIQDQQRIVMGARGIDTVTAGPHDHAQGAIEPVDAVNQSSRGQAAAAAVATKDGHRIVRGSSRIEMALIGAGGNARDAKKAIVCRARHLST